MPGCGQALRGSWPAGAQATAVEELRERDAPFHRVLVCLSRAAAAYRGWIRLTLALHEVVPPGRRLRLLGPTPSAPLDRLNAR